MFTYVYLHYIESCVHIVIKRSLSCCLLAQMAASILRTRLPPLKRQEGEEAFYMQIQGTYALVENEPAATVVAQGMNRQGHSSRTTYVLCFDIRAYAMHMFVCSTTTSCRMAIARAMCVFGRASCPATYVVCMDEHDALP